MNKKMILYCWTFSLAIILFLSGVLFSQAFAEGPFRISLVMSRGGDYIKPFDNKIVIVRQPTPFHVELKNISSTTQQIYKKAMGSAISGLQFEITDESGHTVIMKKKSEHLSSETTVGQYLSPGESRVAYVIIDPDEWENIVIMEPGKEYKVRAIYDNNRKTLYSDYYTVIRR